MPDEVIDIIFELRSAHFQLFNLLVRSEINFFFDAINFVIQPMVLVEHFSEMVVRSFQASDNVPVLWKLS